MSVTATIECEDGVQRKFWGESGHALIETIALHLGVKVKMPTGRRDNGQPVQASHAVSELSTALGMNKSTLHRCILRGDVRAFRLPTPTGAGKWRIPHDEFVRFIAKAKECPHAR